MDLPKNNHLYVLTPDETTLMREYINSCHYAGFTGINNYSRHNEVREFFYRWHLGELIKKFEKSRGAQMVFLTLTIPEVMTLRAMFMRVDCDTNTQQLHKKFYKKELHLIP